MINDKKKVEKANGHHAQRITEIKRDTRKMNITENGTGGSKPLTSFIIILITVVTSACVTMVVLTIWNSIPR